MQKPAPEQSADVIALLEGLDRNAEAKKNLIPLRAPRP